jgi:hypothetical protein
VWRRIKKLNPLVDSPAVEREDADVLKILPESIFHLYALSRPCGLAFGNEMPTGAWANEDGSAWGCLLENGDDGTYSFFVMRRRVDQVWMETHQGTKFPSKAEAYAEIEKHAKRAGLVDVPPGTPRRPPLYDAGDREASEVFLCLAQQSRHPAAWMLNQLYLALPHPDPNWVSDCQTQGFHNRLWEAHLLACLREQGLHVSQPNESPDFRIGNDAGEVAWIEAVTANPPVPYNHYNAPPAQIPEGRESLFFGPAALRFAKTIGNKLDRRYHDLPHVVGHPFVLAIADFQAASSMVWSREGLIGYLYGQGAKVSEVAGELKAEPVPVEHVLGKSKFPAGLFANDGCPHLSAVMFSNACTIPKFYRVPVTAGVAASGFRYTRIGAFFDRTEGALNNIPFCLDIRSTDYRSLWPLGYEPWSAELEVFHNPFAAIPFSMEMLPAATHWFEQNGEYVCRSGYATSILWSKTFVNREDQRTPTLADFQQNLDDLSVPEE